MTNQLQQAEILLGDDIDTFFKSDIGQYIVGRAQQEIDDAVIKLKTVTPEDIKQVRKLQNRINVAEGSLLWLQEALISGKQAMETLQENL